MSASREALDYDTIGFQLCQPLFLAFFSVCFEPLSGSGIPAFRSLLFASAGYLLYPTTLIMSTRLNADFALFYKNETNFLQLNINIYVCATRA